MEHKSNLLTTTEAANYLSLKPSTLEVWRFYGKGPVFLKIGRAVRYRLNDLDAYIESSVRANTSQEA